MATDANSSATTANPPTNSAEKRREARESSITAFIVRTLNTGRLRSTACSSRRIWGSRLLADKEVRTVTLLDNDLNPGYW